MIDDIIAMSALKVNPFDSVNLLKMAEAETSTPSLSELLQRGWDAQRKVEKGELNSGSQDFKVG